MKIDRSSLALPAKDSSTQTGSPALRNTSAIPFAQFLGLGGISEAAKALPAKASAAVSRVLGKAPTTSKQAQTVSPELGTPMKPSSAIAPAPATSASSASMVKQAIAAERDRAAEIVATGIKAGRVNQACALAFDSNLSVREAVAALNAAALDEQAAEPTALNRYNRMGGATASPSASNEARKADSDKALAARIVAAGELTRNPDGARGAAGASNSAKSLAARITAAGEYAAGRSGSTAERTRGKA